MIAIAISERKRDRERDRDPVRRKHEKVDTKL